MREYRSLPVKWLSTMQAKIQISCLFRIDASHSTWYWSGRHRVDIDVTALILMSPWRSWRRRVVIIKTSRFMSAGLTLQYAWEEGLHLAALRSLHYEVRQSAPKDHHSLGYRSKADNHKNIRSNLCNILSWLVSLEPFDCLWVLLLDDVSHVLRLNCSYDVS